MDILKILQSGGFECWEIVELGCCGETVVLLLEWSVSSLSALSEDILTSDEFLTLGAIPEVCCVVLAAKSTLYELIWDDLSGGFCSLVSDDFGSLRAGI